MNEDRRALFEKIKTELVSKPKVYSLQLDVFEATNTVYVIDVSQQPGAHYRGIFVHLIERLELQGLRKDHMILPVNPDTTILVEPTTGNGGEDFILAATKAGYEAWVVMPDGLPESRYRPMTALGGRVVRTPAKEYAEGMRQGLVRLLSENEVRLARRKKIFASPNHCAPEASASTTKLMGKLIDSAHQKINAPVDFLVLAMGNGSSVYGPGKQAKTIWPETKVLAVESLASGLAFEKMYPGTYKDRFGIDPAHARLLEQFKLYGTNAPLGVRLPAQERAIQERVVDELVLVSDDNVCAAYNKLPKVSTENRRAVSQLVRWDETQKILVAKNYPFGNSSAACIGVALRELKGKQGKTALCMVYDRLDKYTD